MNLSDIKEILSKISTLPWETDGYYIWADGMQMVADFPLEGASEDKNNIARIRGVGRGASDDELDANANFIAAAPQIISDLLEQVEAQSAELKRRDELNELLAKRSDMVGVAERRADKLEKKLKIAREALTYYATVECKEEYDWPDQEIARQALKEIE